MLFKTIRNPVISIANYHHAEIILRKAIFVILGSEAVIVVYNAAKRVFQLLLVLVVHSDANAHGR